MNYLAHLYLSGDHHEVMIGNFIADHLRGSEVRQYPEMIRRGVLLHRAIDSFTDNHPVVMQSKERVRPAFRKYAPVAVDVFYDHFLARQWNSFHSHPLDQYAGQCYDLFRLHREILPARTRHMLGYMEPQNWLYNYAQMDGIRKAMTGLSRRARFDSGMEHAHHVLELHYRGLEEDFNLFFPDLRMHAAEFLSQMNDD